jgi:hypothetical protein
MASFTRLALGTRKATGVAALVAGLCASPVFADESLLGQEFVTPPAGQPMCVDPDDLLEYLMAGIKQDNQWAQQVKGCGMLKGGLKVVVIEDLPSDSDISHVVKIRVFNAKGSGVGYTLSLGLRPR